MNVKKVLLCITLCLSIAVFSSENGSQSNSRSQTPTEDIDSFIARTLGCWIIETENNIEKACNLVGEGMTELVDYGIKTAKQFFNQENQTTPQPSSQTIKVIISPTSSNKLSLPPPHAPRSLSPNTSSQKSFRSLSSPTNHYSLKEFQANEHSKSQTSLDSWSDLGEEKEEETE